MEEEVLMLCLSGFTSFGLPLRDLFLPGFSFVVCVLFLSLL